MNNQEALDNRRIAREPCSRGNEATLDPMMRAIDRPQRTKLEPGGITIMVPRRREDTGERKEPKEATRIRVLVVEDHPITRIGIAAIIDATPDMTVVAQAGSGEEAVELYEKHVPDITLMDLRLPGMSGAEAIRSVVAKHRDAKFVVLTTYEGDEDIHQALQAGARSYIVKGMPHEALVDALRRVNEGGRFLPSPVSHTLFSRIPNSELRPREREVLNLIVHGRSNKEIASELGIAESTVKCHVSVILLRLNVTDRTQAVVTALRRGLAHL
jgi:two-component system, NarL family, response regulator